MKKLMTLMLGMAFVFTTVAPTFAQGKEDTAKKEKKAPKKYLPQPTHPPKSPVVFFASGEPTLIVH
ncbi:MAG: hypothetical protein NTW28_20505 [Candidatus Solibacter sp.]|nr:hypothetical protein [Candidatus Solibacter sp.]